MAIYSSDHRLTDDLNKKLDKEEKLTNLQQTELPKLNQFFDLIQSNLDRKNESEFQIKCKELINLTKLFLNSNNIQQNLIETGTIFIVYVFYELLLIDRGNAITDQCLFRLEQIFDKSNLTKRIVNQALDLCKFLFSLIDEETLHYFFQDNLIKKSKSNEEPNNDEPNINKSIGTDKLTVTDKIANLLNFNMQSIESIPEPIDKNQLDNGKDVEWLENELKRVLEKESDLCFSLEDLISIIYDRFQDSKYSDDIFQNDLLNLLGFNQIELIGEIIQNRKSILRSFRRRLGQVDDSPATYQSTSNNTTNNVVRPKQQSSKRPPIYFKEQKMPSFTQTILIQTEQELKEQKLLNKLEKKVAYQERKRQKANYNENDELTNDYDISNYQPILNNEHSEFNFYLKRLENERVPIEDLPYVFDLYSDIKQTSSFASNQKLLLPEGTEMNDQISYKEITVPAPEKPKKEVLQDFPLISIDKLDNISKKIFTGFKTLNQIQSVVYETASKTNENLLISSPTGSGM